MSLVLDNILKLTNDATYSLVLNSSDRIAGTHNNSTFDVDWDRFLPQDIQNFKVCFTFQSTSGFYCDGVYQKNPQSPTVGVTETLTNSDWTKTNNVGANLMTFNSTTGVVVGNLVYGVGVPINTTITGLALPNNQYAYISNVLTGRLKDSNSVQLVNPATVNAVGFSTARIMADFGSKSFSYDPSIRGQSTNLGVISRDTQTLTSRSNAYSAFYCQSAPRTIKRPTKKIFKVSIMNNSVFQGGISGYKEDNSITSYSTVASDNNFLVDTVNMQDGGRVAGGLLSDMTPWTMTMEFVPIFHNKPN